MSMSDGGSEDFLTGHEEQETCDILVGGIHRAIGGRPESEITAALHASACRKLLRLRDKLLRGDEISATARLVLACVGVIANRRAAVLLPANEEETDEAATQQGGEYATTALLIFVVLSLATPPPHFSCFDLEQVVQRAEKSCLWSHLRDGAADPTDANPPIWVNRPSEGSGVTLNAPSPMAWEDDDDHTYNNLPVDCNVAQSCLALGCIQAMHPEAKDAEKRMRWLSIVFFRHTSQQLSARQLRGEEENDFLSLSASAFASAVSSSDDSRIGSIVAAAESEAGQSVLRDLILSFLLPADVLGVRTTLLLSRKAAYEATINFAEEVQYAHEAAMAGAEWLMQNTTDELRLSCVLLAGIACLTTRGGADPIRKAQAFGGRVALPFLETNPPEDAAACRITLLAESRTWILFKLNGGGKPAILSSACDYGGLRLAVAGLVASL